MRYCVLCCCLLLALPVFSQGETEETTAALALINKMRRAADLDTVAISQAISEGCQKHAKYLVLNKDNPLTSGLSAHKEYPQLAGYSKAGANAAKQSVIHYIRPVPAIRGFFQTFYHRIPLLQPKLKTIGIGYYEKDDYVVTLIDCGSGVVGESDKAVVLFPNAGQTDVPLKMVSEIPHPIGQVGEYGFPITLYFAQWQGISDVTLTLTDKNKKRVVCYLSSPEQPATSFDQWGSICAIPHKPLLAGAEYFVSVSCKVNGVPFKKSYRFKTVVE